ncbi:acidic leucine-rich nuclear phosphoprotein 32 family member B [Scomber japonicus]|uniref:acidic leucine-rich nuclear phosphoprotein 32 family member B n=1 Tax=Scomber japonicus TaxID=13676 RepID=UPI00230695BC|nr:acidic leucine-rich nuclear phosphoprotein 32 family member B [Scomber japonicus]XP_053198940.1 acidic leucine-rich nuclear phosphoprotein 32 family member B [Scomber japonicus]XP_053198941.1 acidic leucine-rich nuclear phosphoprotein 32 family member B [Scomber japonicus]
MSDNIDYHTSTKTVLLLLSLLVVLIALLIFFYKKLNKENNGDYTIRHIVTKEGGLRDQVRGAATFLGTRLGVQRSPSYNSEQDEEEMQDEEQHSSQHSSQRNDSDDDEQDEEDDEEQPGERKRKGGSTSDDDSSHIGSDLEEEISLMGQSEATGGDEDGKGEASAGGGLLINLSQLSGSAIWSDDKGDEVKVCDVTAL